MRIDMGLRTYPPDDARFAFTPAYTPEEEPQQIRLVFEGEAGYYSTSMYTPNLDTAEALCAALNERIGLTADEARELVSASMAAVGGRSPESPSNHLGASEARR